LPLLEDADSVQMALMQVIQKLACGGLDHKTAGLMLYALQTASSNLRHVTFEVSDATRIAIDPNDVHRTCIDGPQWFEEDFEADGGSEADEEDVNEDEAEEDEADEEAADVATNRNPREVAGLRPPALPTGRNPPMPSQGSLQSER
jgi:hypothetical protein